jgi:hypothetical protein
MCRYGMYGPYKEKFACFHCRKTFKQTWRSELRTPMRADAEGNRIALCPECGRAMKNMGRDFQAPRQSDIRQWKKVELLFARGYAYHSCGCCGPGPRPATLREVPAFMAEQERQRVERERQQALTERDAKREALRRQRLKAREERRHKRLLTALHDA